ncbi:TLDc domain-containing protein, partial [Baffinella frigidus]
EWEQLFSTAVDGVSVSTFFRKTGWRSPTLLLVKDDKRAVFGAYCSAPWYPLENHFSYFGTGECFVFKWNEEKQELGVFRWSRANDHFQLARKGQGISVGAGGADALRLDGDFLHGSSGPCETFRSPTLSSAQVPCPSG